MNFNFSKRKHLSLGLNFPSRQYIMGSSTELHQISTINEENDLVLLLVTTSNLDLMSTR